MTFKKYKKVLSDSVREIHAQKIIFEMYKKICEMDDPVKKINPRELVYDKTEQRLIREFVESGNLVRIIRFDTPIIRTKKRKSK